MPNAGSRHRAAHGLVAAVVGLALTVTACGGGAAGVQGQSEVKAEPISTNGTNPFTSTTGHDSSGVTPPPAAAGQNGGPATYSASTPGLYGGTRNYAECDATKLVTFLQQNPAKAAAWASTLGIQTSQIQSYVSTLTPVTLRTDTRVTNHGYVDGRADPIQSVLEAGTAAFVDKYGSPVVKCYCGNPLTAPTLLTAPRYVGSTWPGFSTTNITIIHQSTTIIQNFTLYNLKTGKTFTRPAGSDGQSDGPDQQGASSTGLPPAPSPPGGQQSNGAENPSASFSPNPGHQGDTFTLSASGFQPGAQLDVTLTRPDGVVEHYTISAGGDGTGSYSFSNTQNVITGTYSATVTNSATGAQASASVDVQPSSGASGGGAPSGNSPPGNSGSGSGTPNSGTPNSGTPNSGTPNSGTPNSGTPNSGSTP